MTGLTDKAAVKKLPVRSLVGHRLLALGVMWGMSCGLILPTAHARKFWHATHGNIDIYTSASPDSTREFLGEFLAVRHEIEILVAPVPLPNPRIQLVVFGTPRDYESFQPEGLKLEDGMENVSGFTVSEYGLTAAVVKESAMASKFGRDVVLYFYARYLLANVLPRAPRWIEVGLPSVLAGTTWRRGKAYLGGDFMGHERSVRSSKLIPLARLMNDAEMEQYAINPKHDNVLYHESWALWHQWLTAKGPGRREQVRALFAALRRGETGDFATVARVFGEPAEAIERAHRTRPLANAFPVVEAGFKGGDVVKGIEFSVASDLDAKFALAMLYSRTGKGLGALDYELLQLGSRYPESPRVMEARAALSMGENDLEVAATRWAKARELGTDNPFAYLIAARTALRSRQFRLSLKPELTEERAEMLRAWVDRCLELDSGQAEAHYYRLLVEAFAPTPRKAAVDATDASRIFAREPSAMLYLAIARWRLGEGEIARAVLEEALAQPGLDKNLRDSLVAMRTAMAPGTAVP